MEDSENMKQVLGKVADLYTESLREHGMEARGVGWGDECKHKVRFDKLLYLLEGEKEAVSINDLGCGYGSLFEELDARNYKISAFHGYDISADMLTAAKERLSLHEQVRLYPDPFLKTKADYSFSSGIFNVRFNSDETAWQSHVLQTLDNMNEFSAKGFAFNVLSSYVDWHEDHLYYADPCFYFDHCKKNYSKKVALLHDSDLYEWTMVVRK